MKIKLSVRIVSVLALVTAAIAVPVALMPDIAGATPASTPQPLIFTGCGLGDAGITYKGTLIRVNQPSPDGPLGAVLGGENFVIDCQPLSGSVTIQLQWDVKSGWQDRGDSARFNFPTSGRGFSLAVGPWVCAGTGSHKWRIAIFSSGISGDGTPWGPATDFDSLIGGSGGKSINCN